MNVLSKSTFAQIMIVAIASLMMACETDPISPEPVIESPLIALNYDGANQDAPSLQGAQSYEGAIRILKSDLGTAAHGSLQDIFFYIREKPETASVKVYSGTTTEGAPETQLYSSIVSQDVQANAWNTHTIPSSVILPDDDIWISIGFAHTPDQRTLGCDQGPANPNGEWLFSNVSGEWSRLSEIAPAININWNIRASVRPN